jgi:predicted heme/steroid binding protein
MAVMGVTGSILTWYRIPSLDVLLYTRFGILLLIKIGLFLVMVVTALLAVLVIGPRLRKRTGAAGPVPAAGNLTMAELALCDGKEGRPAYFVWNNRIFDSTASRFWKQGMHMGRHPAGTDLTEALRQAPHGEEKILPLAQVGEVVSGGAEKPAQPVRIFYTMAYLNLTLVFAIILIIALWRWG